jgi:G3E family GTPase
MSASIQVILITGFLGSGKTTLLNRLIEQVPRSCRMAILMNEFGEIGIDGALLKGDDLEIVEVSRGSIFCICVKRDFLKALSKIANEMKPDILVIESTGVANPRDFKRDLALPMLKDHFHLAAQLCVIDALLFEEAYSVFSAIEKQLESSSLFLINKVDLAAPEQILRVKEITSQHCAHPRFVESVFCNIDLADILGGSVLWDGHPDLPESMGTPLSAEQLDLVIEQMMADPFREISPPDQLVSVAYTWQGEVEPFRQLLDELPQGIVRGKGFLLDGDKICLLNILMDRRSLEEFSPGAENEHLLNRIVFIFRPELMPRFEAAAGKWRQLRKLTERPCIDER